MKQTEDRQARQRRAEPRLFRPTLSAGHALAIRPESLNQSWVYKGALENDRTEDGIAIITIHGPLEHHESYWWDSYDSILARIEDAILGEDLVKEYKSAWWRDDEECPAPTPARAIVLRIDSPGGEAAGATYAHRRIRALRKKYGVPFYAYADEMVCSAAYELASACDEIWLPDTGMVGSIGVIATLFDRTEQNKMIGLNIELVTSGACKADNHADRVIDDAIRGRIQKRVDDLALVFWRVVAKARGTSPRAIAELEANVFIGHEAVDVGIADGVAGWNKFLRIVGRTLDTQPEMNVATNVVTT
jgi:hypothetical protein